MKKIYLLVLLNFFLIQLEAQDFSWAKVEGRYAYDYGYGIETDNSGNVYVAGKYEENAIFSSTILPLQGNHDGYLAQYSSSGSLKWIRTLGGIYGDYARTLACDKTGHVYIAGEIEGFGTVISFPGSPITITSQGENDVFVASYDLSGVLLWAKDEGYYTNEKAMGITYDSLGNVIICGFFTDTTKFDGVMTIGDGGKDMFVAKYDMNGNFLWMKHAGGPGEEEAKSVTCDASGNIYVCGMYSDSAVFGSTTFLTPNTTIGHFFNAYIAKYAPDGTLIWVKSAGGDYDDIAWSITKDKNEKIYITGEYSDAMFDNIHLFTNGKSDIFVACYDQNGTAQWAVHGGGQIADRARGIGSDGDKIFITGQFGDTAYFGASTITAADSSDIFIAELDNSGSFLWATAVGGSHDAFEEHGYESGIAICADSSGTAYVTGALLNGGIFGAVANLNAYDRTDVFIAKMTTIVDIEDLSRDNKINIYPNPGNGIFKITSEKIFNNTDINVYNYLGEIVYQTLDVSSSEINVDLSKLNKGIYFVQVTSDKNVSLGKIIIQ